MQTDDETEEQITLTGKLIGADVKGCTFHMEFDEGEGIRGRFKDAISHVHTVELPKEYKATMTKKEKVYFATGKVEVTYFLIRLDPAD